MCVCVCVCVDVCVCVCFSMCVCIFICLFLRQLVYLRYNIQNTLETIYYYYFAFLDYDGK